MKTPTRITLPPSDSMTRMLQLTNRLHALPPRQRLNGLLRGLIELLDAGAAAAWSCGTGDAPKCATLGFVTARPQTGLGAPEANDDPATTAILELPPHTSGPVPMLRRQLVAAGAWQLRGAIGRLARREKVHDALYSHRVHNGTRTILAIYRGDTVRLPFSTDHAILLRMLHDVGVEH